MPCDPNIKHHVLGKLGDDPACVSLCNVSAWEWVESSSLRSECIDSVVPIELRLRQQPGLHMLR
eukprot:8247249-Alexandrium_andersonii.AAC.1